MGSDSLRHTQSDSSSPLIQRSYFVGAGGGTGSGTGRVSRDFSRVYRTEEGIQEEKEECEEEKEDEGEVADGREGGSGRGRGRGTSAESATSVSTSAPHTISPSVPSSAPHTAPHTVHTPTIGFKKKDPVKVLESSWDNRTTPDVRFGEKGNAYVQFQNMQRPHNHKGKRTYDVQSFLAMANVIDRQYEESKNYTPVLSPHSRSHNKSMGPLTPTSPGSGPSPRPHTEEKNKNIPATKNIQREKYADKYKLKLYNGMPDVYHPEFNSEEVFEVLGRASSTETAEGLLIIGTDTNDRTDSANHFTSSTSTNTEIKNSSHPNIPPSVLPQPQGTKSTSTDKDDNMRSVSREFMYGSKSARA